MPSSSILETIMDPLTSSLHMGLSRKLPDIASLRVATYNREKSFPVHSIATISFHLMSYLAKKMRCGEDRGCTLYFHRLKRLLLFFFFDERKRYLVSIKLTWVSSIVFTVVFFFSLQSSVSSPQAAKLTSLRQVRWDNSWHNWASQFTLLLGR